ncbi:MAG: hypothetical protein Q8P17_04615 [bacterium]|nr:hypothetical protein [bacterium]
MKKKYTVTATLIILAIAGGVYAWKTASDPYEGWKMYRNDEVGYSIKYPADFTVKKIETTDYDRENNPRLVEIEKESVTFKNIERNIVFLVSVLDNPLELPPREWVHWAWNDPLHDELVAESLSDITINGMQAIATKGTQEKMFGFLVYLVNEKKAFDFAGGGTPENQQEDELLFNKFVKSLQVD